MLSVIIPAAEGRQSNLNLVLTSLEAQTLARDLFEVIVVSDGGGESLNDVLRAHKALAPVLVWQPKHDPLNGELGKRLGAVLPAQSLAMNSPEAAAWQSEQRGFFRELVAQMNQDAPRRPWVNTMQPRNRGARNARFPFLIFADSDVVLHPRALEYYAEDFQHNPQRVVIGMYHWLKPMRVTPMDVRQHFDDILNERLQSLPVAPNAHSIMRDPRAEAFQKYGRDYVFQPRDPREKMAAYPAYLNMYSGNIGWNAELFWRIGGYWDALACGAHEDGASGVAACEAGIPLSFDARIVGGHINHPFNAAYRSRLWLHEIPLINARYRLEDYADGSGELRDHLPSLATMSDETLKWLGVWDWDPKRRGATEGSA